MRELLRRRFKDPKIADQIHEADKKWREREMAPSRSFALSARSLIVVFCFLFFFVCVVFFWGFVSVQFQADEMRKQINAKSKDIGKRRKVHVRQY